MRACVRLYVRIKLVHLPHINGGRWRQMDIHESRPRALCEVLLRKKFKAFFNFKPRIEYAVSEP